MMVAKANAHEKSYKEYRVLKNKFLGLESTQDITEEN